MWIYDNPFISIQHTESAVSNSCLSQTAVVNLLETALGGNYLFRVVVVHNLLDSEAELVGDFNPSGKIKVS